MDKSEKKKAKKKFYWGVTSWDPNGKAILFEGTYSDCWKHLVKEFGQYKLSYIVGELGLKIERIN